MATEDKDAFAEAIRRGVADCLVMEVLAERMAESADEIEISLPVDVAFRDND